MARRMFYVDEIRSGSATLRGESAQHLRKVLRAEPGQRFEISDNQSLYLAELVSYGKDLAEFAIVSEIDAPRAPLHLHLLPALIKFDRFEWILEKATELGVELITPVYALRTDKGLDQAAVKRMDRWSKILAESGQQSRRATRPVLHPPVRLTDALASHASLRFFLDEDPAAPPLLSAIPPERSSADSAALLIGPEGGWDERERALSISSGWTAVSLGPQILRAETAAVAALAAISCAWQTVSISTQTG
ncbi:MAG: 16S rRNA methyltransferase [Candidatus Solibacter sp.]|nr:16S rRNA methyltransferase [Candidatus Solibacter sp.]